MQVDIPANEFLSFKRRIQEMNRAYQAMWPNLHRAIMTQEKPFCALQVSILMFILTLTYVRGRQAAQIMGYQFHDGVPHKDKETLICNGLGLAKNTLKKHITELSDNGFLTIYVSKVVGTVHENEAKIFEIDCKKMLEGGVKNGVRGEVNSDTHHIGINGLAKANLPAVRGSRVINSSRGKVVALKTPKKGYWQSPTPNEIAPTEVVAQIKAVATTRSAARRSAAEVKPAHLLNREEMQALIDKHMATYRPGEPRMLVTLRELGHWRKTLKQTTPDSFDKFIGWTIRQWTEIALQNRKSIKRREEAGQKGTVAMPLTPSFSALAYRYTYMLKAYVNDQASRATAPEVEERQDKKVKELTAQIERMSHDQQILRKRLSSRTVTPPAEPRARLTRIAPAPKKVDSEFPEWDAPVGDTNAKRA